MKLRLFLLMVFVGLILIQPLQSQQYNESNDFSYALKLYNEGFYDIAAQQFSTFINRYPVSDRMGDARYYYADSYYKLKEYDDARIEFQGLAVGYPDHSRAADAWLRVGECYEILDKPLEAAKAYETIKILYPGNPLAPKGLINSGRLYASSGDVNRAEQILKEFLDRYVESSDYPQGRTEFGYVLLEKGELERAIAEFERVPSLTTDKDILGRALLGQGEAMQRLGLIGRSTKVYSEIVQGYGSRSSAFTALSKLVGIHQGKREYDEALSLIRRHAGTFAGGSYSDEITLLEAQCQLLKGSPAAAASKLQPLRSSGALSPGQKNLASYYLACAYLENKQFDQALPIYNDLLNDANTPEALRTPILINLANLHLENNNVASARSIVQKLHEVAPGSQNNRAVQEKLVLKAFSSGELSVGIDELQRYLGSYSTSPKRDDLTFAAGKAYFNSGQFQRSLIYFEQVVEEYPASIVGDSSQAYIDYINNYDNTGEQAGVSELAKLMGKLITGEKKEALVFELGEIYISKLKDFEAAADIFTNAGTTNEDSLTTAKRLYYLSESKLMLAKKKEFLNQPSEKAFEVAGNELKKAMAYVKNAPHPDKLMYRFLTVTLPDDLPLDKYLQFWSVFESSYPQSKHLAEAYIAIADKCERSGKADLAGTYLDKAISLKGYFGGKAAVKRGKRLLAEGKRAEGESVLKTFLLETKKHPNQAEAYWMLSESALAKGDTKASAAFLERLAEDFDYTEAGVKAGGKTIENLISAGDYATATRKISRQLEESTIIDPVAAGYMAQPDPAWYFYAGKAAYRQQNFADARSNLLEYLNRVQGIAYQNESLYLLGTMAIEEQDVQSALLHLELVDKNGNQEYYQSAGMEAGQLLYEARRFEESLARYKGLEGLPAVQQQMLAKAMQIRNLIQLGRDKEAKAQSETFKKQFGKNKEASNHMASFEYERGKKAFTNKSYDPALRYQKNVLKKYKNSSYADDAKYFVARIQTTMNRTKDALKTLDEFQKQYPSSDLLGNVYLTRAEIHFRDEQEDQGLAAVKKAAEIATTPSVKRSSLALLINTYQNMGLWDGALQKTREYISLYPNASDIMSKKISVGIFLSRANRYTEALDYLQKIKFEVSSQEEPEVQFYIGEALYNSGQYDRAINEFLKIPLLSQKTKLQWEASALYFAGQSYEKLNKPDDAIRMYEEITSRPGIQVELKREARSLINKLRNLN